MKRIVPKERRYREKPRDGKTTLSYQCRNSATRHNTERPWGIQEMRKMENELMRQPHDASYPGCVKKGKGKRKTEATTKFATLTLTPQLDGANQRDKRGNQSKIRSQ